jgi:hypothetical protein
MGDQAPYGLSAYGAFVCRGRGCPPSVQSRRAAVQDRLAVYAERGAVKVAHKIGSGGSSWDGC